MHNVQVHCTSDIICLYGIFLSQALTKKQERGSSTTGAQVDKVTEESLEVFGGTCSRGAWRQFFEATGGNFRVSWFKAELSTPKMCLQPKSFRNLGPAHHCLCCCRGLRNPRRCLLQHGRLILILSLLSNHKANCTSKAN